MAGLLKKKDDNTINKYYSAVNNSENNTEPNTSETTNNSSNQQSNYYDLARKQEFTTLLDKEIQLENAKANALKYTNNQLANAGLNTQGYGSSANTGIYNQYLNALTSAKNTYDTNVNNINLQEQEAGNDRFESITTMLTQASTLEQMNNLLQDYGYGTVDSEGNFNFNEKPEGISDDDWYQIKYYYNLQKNNIGAIDNVTTGAAWDGTDNFYYYDSKGSFTGSTDTFSEQANTLKARINSGIMRPGTYIVLVNPSGNRAYLYYGKDGSIKYVSSAIYEKNKTSNNYAVIGSE